MIHTSFSDDAMSTDELLKAVDNLSEPDLANLVKRVMFVRARHQANLSIAEETALLQEIRKEIPPELNDRYETLLDKRDDEALTETEYAELLDLSRQIECFGVTRVEALAKLATIRQVPLLKLMEDLGIQSPGVR
jgi:hypothetical protein